MFDLDNYDNINLAIYFRNQLKLYKIGDLHETEIEPLIEYVESRVNKLAKVPSIEELQWNRILKLGVQDYKEFASLNKE